MCVFGNCVCLFQLHVCPGSLRGICAYMCTCVPSASVPASLLLPWNMSGGCRPLVSLQLPRA